MKSSILSCKHSYERKNDSIIPIEGFYTNINNRYTGLFKIKVKILSKNISKDDGIIVKFKGENFEQICELESIIEKGNKRKVFFF